MEKKQVEEISNNEKKTGGEKKHQSKLDEFGDHVERFAVKTAESIRRVLDNALSARNTVLTIRVNDESNKKLTMLVDAGLFKSRSESAAFLIQEGIKRQKTLFEKITTKLKKIDELREELKDIISEEVKTEETKDNHDK